jgi:organic hydroperoxide reductase OsmC/OhrA
MSEHVATIHWTRTSADFRYESYNRAHAWRFAEGVEVQASAAPAYLGDGDRVDPEQALVAAISSCHLLAFLAVAARKRYVVDSYEDAAVGVLTKNEQGRLWLSRVTLRPKIVFSGAIQPNEQELAGLHDLAHRNCFIAASVKSEVVVEAP